MNPLVAGLCDDAALFPPGNAPFSRAVTAHLAHRRSGHAALVGPLVVPADRLVDLPAVLAGRGLAVSVTVPRPEDAVTALGRVRRIGEVRPVAVEIAVPAGCSAVDVLGSLSGIAAAATGVDVYVEVPRDGSGTAILAGLPGARCRAKFRTGGVTAEAHPDEAELAASIMAAVARNVAFKATAGLHHAARNTDPDTGFEQHGFLNLMLATHLAGAGGGADAVAAALADRDGARLAAALAALPAAAVTALRRRFRSYGTCDIGGPLADLTTLGLLPAAGTRPDEGTPA